MRNHTRNADNVLLLTGKGVEILFARGTSAPIAAFLNGQLILAGDQQEIVNTHLSSHTTQAPVVTLMEDVTAVLDEAA